MQNIWVFKLLGNFSLETVFTSSVKVIFIDYALNFTEASHFMSSHLSTVSLSVCDNGIIFRKWSLGPMLWRLLHTFSNLRFSVVRFILVSLIHLDLTFVYGDNYESICILLHDGIQLCQYHLLKMFSFFYWMILASLSKIGCS